MGIRISDVLTYANLQDAKLVYGISGLNRIVENVSVFDSDFRKIPKEYDLGLDKDTLFLSAMAQFEENDHDLREWLHHMVGNGASGLITMEDSLRFFSEEAASYCNEEGFPVIAVNEQLPYSVIIKEISNLLYFDSLYINREITLRRSMDSEMAEKDRVEAVKTLCPNAGSKLRIIIIAGRFRSSLYDREFDSQISAKRDCVCSPFDKEHLILLTDKEEAGLERKTRAAKALVEQYFEDFVAGESKCYDLAKANLAIRNAQSALSIAKIRKTTWEKYDDLSDIAILLPLGDTEVVRDFHRRMLDVIEQCETKGDGAYLECIREYVSCCGEFKVMAPRLFQSENAVRYKINKLKSALGLEKNNVRFDEILCLFDSIDRILQL